MQYGRSAAVAAFVLVALWGIAPRTVLAQQASSQGGGPTSNRPAARQVRPTTGNPQAQPGTAITRTANAPFQLTPNEQQELNRLLTAWEQRNRRIKTFTASFKRWEYDDVFNTETVAIGDIKYGAPDKGSYRVKGDQPEHWVCDGTAIYEYNEEKKQLIERRLPPQLQGKAIADGPLPFIFGAEAEKLRQRYFMRVITPPGVKDQIWLEAHPRHQQDAANFSKAELILNAQTLDPYAIQIYLPSGNNRTVHQFYDLALNDPFDRIKNFFATPTTPVGWKRIVEEAPQAPTAETPPLQAQRANPTNR